MSERYNMYVVDGHSEVIDIKKVKSIEVEIVEDGEEYFETYVPGGKVKAIKFEEEEE